MNKERTAINHTHAPLHAPVTTVRPAVAQYIDGGHGVHALTFCRLMAVE